MNDALCSNSGRNMGFDCFTVRICYELCAPDALGVCADLIETFWLLCVASTVILSDHARNTLAVAGRCALSRSVPAA